MGLALIILGCMAYLGVGLGIFMSVYETEKKRRSRRSFLPFIMVFWPMLTVSAIVMGLLKKKG